MGGSPAALAKAGAGVEEAVGHVVEHGLWCSARKNCWNTKPILPARSAESSLSESCEMSKPVTRTMPLVGRSSVPIRWSKRRLARTGRPDDADELPLMDRETHAPKGLDGRLGRVGLGHLVQLEHYRPAVGARRTGPPRQARLG